MARRWQDIPEGEDHVGERLQYVCDHLRVSAHQLGKRARIKSPGHVGAIIRTGTGAHAKTIRPIAETWGVDFFWLLHGHGEPFPHGLLNKQLPMWDEMVAAAKARHPKMPHPAFAGASEFSAPASQKEATIDYVVAQAQSWLLMTSNDVDERVRAERVDAGQPSVRRSRSSGTMHAVQPEKAPKKTRGS